MKAAMLSHEYKNEGEKMKFYKMKTLLTLLSVVLLVLPFTQDAWSQQSGDKPPAREKWSLVNLQASVEAIDHDKREVTLKGPAGNLVTVIVGEQVKRFDEIKVGDSVRAQYWTFMRAEFREPTAEEKEIPLIVLAEAGRALKDVPPAAAVGAVVKAVVKVVAIDKAARLATIQGPQGNFLVLPVVDDRVLNNLDVGEVVIMTYAEAVVLSLIKTK